MDGTEQSVGGWVRERARERERESEREREREREGHWCVDPDTDVHTVLQLRLATDSVTSDPVEVVLINNNNVHLSRAHQRPERSHDTY